MASLMVMCISLLVYALAERALQEGMTDGKLIQKLRGRFVGKFNSRRISQLFEGLDALTLTHAGRQAAADLEFPPLPHIENIYDMKRGCGR